MQLADLVEGINSSWIWNSFDPKRVQLHITDSLKVSNSEIITFDFTVSKNMVFVKKSIYLLID